MACASCGARYPVAESGQIDLRLGRPVPVTLQVELGRPPVDSLDEATLDPNPSPEVDLEGFVLPANVSSRFVSYLPQGRPEERALDLGCGNGPDRELLERAGYQWFGVDYFDEQSPILADGQALPFKDGTFDLVFSVAVIECFAHPQVAMPEAARVLRPGGRYLASVAFQSPHIPYSQFHYSHVGVLGALHGAGLKPEVIMADRRWSSLEASAVLGLFPPPQSARVHRSGAAPRRPESSVVGYGPSPAKSPSGSTDHCRGAGSAYRRRHRVRCAQAGHIGLRMAPPRSVGVRRWSTAGQRATFSPGSCTGAVGSPTGPGSILPP